MIHDAKIEKPKTENGISDPIVAFTSKNMVVIAWWDERSKCWWNLESDSFGIRREWFGDVLYWSEIKFPQGWNYDEEVYGGKE